MHLYPTTIYQLGRGLLRKEGREKMRRGIHIRDCDYTNRNHLGSLEQNEEVI